MDRPRRVLGDYYQLLLKNGLLADPAPLRADLTREVRLVSCDSQSVVPGTLFLCKGAAFRPEYLRDAVRKGAFCYVSEQPYPEAGSAPCIQVRAIRPAMALLADACYGHPSGQVKVLGITGTKGKTTTAYYLKSILDDFRSAAGACPTAILSSIITDDGVERRSAALTTPEPLELQRHLFRAWGAGAEYVTMEVSSQALKYHRVQGVEFAVGLFLNIGEDHISPIEHPDFEDYFSSKMKLFSQCECAVVNLDSDHAPRILAAAGQCGRVFTFSRKDPRADVYASDLKKEGNATCFTVRTPRFTGALRLPMPGLFNVENALAAVAAAEALGVPEAHIRAGLAVAQVPGRMETYRSADKTRSVVVDYAHNGMSLEALLSSLRSEYPQSELTVVFGCTGGKGLDRREGMANAAGRWADRIILTEDDPAGEEVEAICADVARYLPPWGKTARIIPDRPAAVETAILTAAPGGVVVLAGKGAEMQQKRKNGAEPCVPDGLLAQEVLSRYDREAQT